MRQTVERERTKGTQLSRENEIDPDHEKACVRQKLARTSCARSGGGGDTSVRQTCYRPRFTIPRAVGNTRSKEEEATHFTTQEVNDEEVTGAETLYHNDEELTSTKVSKFKDEESNPQVRQIQRQRRAVPGATQRQRSHGTHPDMVVGIPEKMQQQISENHRMRKQASEQRQWRRVHFSCTKQNVIQEALEGGDQCRKTDILHFRRDITDKASTYGDAKRPPRKLPLRIETRNDPRDIRRRTKEHGTETWNAQYGGVAVAAQRPQEIYKVQDENEDLK